MILNNNHSKLLTGCLLTLAVLFLEGCGEPRSIKYLDKLCGNWESINNKPDVLIFKEGEQYKLTLFKKSGATRKVKPETYLIIEENDNLFINTGFRIDISYNEATDILTFSPNGDYTRVSNNKKSEEQ